VEIALTLILSSQKCIDLRTRNSSADEIGKRYRAKQGHRCTSSLPMRCLRNDVLASRFLAEHASTGVIVLFRVL